MSNTQLLNQSWDYLSKQLTHFEESDDYLSKLTDALRVLRDQSFVEVLIEWYYDLYYTFINEELVPHFWSTFRNHQQLSEDTANTSTAGTTHAILFSTADHLFVSANKWINNVVLSRVFDTNGNYQQYVEMQMKMKSLLRSILLAEIPICFNQYLLSAYSLAFAVNQYQKNRANNSCELNGSVDMIEMDTKCGGCCQQTNDCLCQSISEDFLKFNQQLSELSLIEVISGDAITSVMHTCIDKHIYESCKGNFEVSCICNLKNWIDNTVINWVRFVYEMSSFGNSLSNLEERLTHFLYET
ncbi:unnamed protein product, partial [Medioppia subpectinata]